MIRELSEEDRDILGHLAERLWEKNHQTDRRPPRFSGWAGILKGQDESMSSVDWQHIVSKWRSEEK